MLRSRLVASSREQAVDARGKAAHRGGKPLHRVFRKMARHLRRKMAEGVQVG